MQGSKQGIQSADPGSGQLEQQRRGEAGHRLIACGLVVHTVFGNVQSSSFGARSCMLFFRATLLLRGWSDVEHSRH